MKTVLLTLGRLPKALALARACHAAGCRVLVADPFRWHLCRPSRSVDRCYRPTAPNTSLPAYHDDLLQIIEREQVDLVLPVSEEALHVAELAPRLPASVRLLAAERESLAALHDKLQFIRHAQSLGLAVPETCAYDDPAAAALAQRVDYVEKPVHSCSGIGLHFGRAGDNPAAPAAGVIRQARLQGEQLSSLALVHEGRQLVNVFYRGRVFAGTVAVCFERVDSAPSAQAWIDSFLSGGHGGPDLGNDLSRYSGFLAFDFFVGEDGQARAIECNPRATSGVHFLDPASLGAALLDPQRCSGVALSGEDRYQWAYSTLTEAYAALFRPREFMRRLGEMFTARDTVWAAGDPLPFLLMTPMSWEILWPAMTTPLSLGEATQRDIAWFGSAP